jgi:hypothetical protein
MTKSLLMLVSALALIALGCNSNGTCIREPEAGADSEDGPSSMCMLEYPKAACDKIRDGKFFEEDKSAGLLRCKSMGFESSAPGSTTLFKSGSRKGEK